MCQIVEAESEQALPYQPAWCTQAVLWSRLVSWALFGNIFFDGALDLSPSFFDDALDDDGALDLLK